MKIAVIGAGIAGLSAAWRLARAGQDVTLFEAGDYFGGHTHTVDVNIDGQQHGVDTGFLVFNHKTYPHLVRLFEELKVPTAGTDMSFSVKVPQGARTLEWAGTNLNSVFVQRRNLFNGDFLRMLRDILRFNREATRLALYGNTGAMREPLGAYLKAQGYSDAFRDWYLLPMAGCIWSCPVEQMLHFPLATFVHFCHNHGLLQVSDRPRWYTVAGGARQYVEKMLADIPQARLNAPVSAVTRSAHLSGTQVQVESRFGRETFDHAVLACHSDQSLAMLKDANGAERGILGAVKYQPNRAVLHTDARCLPTDERAWAAWNYQSAGDGSSRVCVHYLLNRLQPLPFKTPVIVSLNPIDEPDPQSVIDEYDYAHPVFDTDAVAAQSKLAMVQGRMNTWFAGAWTGYGFHEDGLKSGLAVAEAILGAEKSLRAAA